MPCSLCVRTPSAAESFRKRVDDERRLSVCYCSWPSFVSFLEPRGVALLNFCYRIRSPFHRGSELAWKRLTKSLVLLRATTALSAAWQQQTERSFSEIKFR